MSASLESKSRVTASIDGVGSLGVFATRTGGNADSEEVKHADGGGLPERAHGGRPTTDNVTITRRYDPDRDGPLRSKLFAARGVRPMTVSEQRLDADDNAVGAPTVWTGVVKSFQMPDSDRNSNDMAMLTIEMSTDAPVAA
jgi:hypothetical protein